MSAWQIQFDRNFTLTASGTGVDGSFSPNPFGAQISGEILNWSEQTSQTETVHGSFVVSGPPGCEGNPVFPHSGCHTPDYSFPGSVSATYNQQREELVLTRNALCPPSGGSQSLTTAISGDNTQALDGSAAGSIQGPFWIDYSTNPPRAESDVNGPNLPISGTLSYSGCVQSGTESYDNSTQAALQFRYSDAAADAGGDTQVRVVNGQFLVEGTANYSDTRPVCTHYFEVTCLPGQFQSTTHWTARPYCAPIAAADLLGSNAVSVVDSMPALDGDGIPTCWKQNDIRIKRADGSLLTVHLPGAQAGRKDLYVQVDYTQGHQPAGGTLPAVTAAFAAAPVANLDGSTGIALHATLQNQLPPTDPIAFDAGNRTAGDFWSLKNGTTNGTTENCATGSFGITSASDRTNPDCPLIVAAKRLIYRYAIFAGHYVDPTTRIISGSSGISEPGGNDFMVSLGAPLVAGGPGWTPAEITAAGGQVAAEAGTFMHELGHTLGLQHGGDESLNCKPNYLSVMNYSYQFAFQNQNPNRPLDYSHGTHATLDEANLAESAGIGGAPGQFAVFGLGGLPWSAPADGSIDWNNDNTIGSVSADVDRIDTEKACAGPGGASVDGSSLSAQFTATVNGIVVPFWLDGGIIPSTSAFTVGVNGSARPVQHVSVYGDRLYLTLASPVAAGDTLTLSYTKPLTSPLTGLFGGSVASWSGAAVTNVTGGRQTLHDYNDWANLKYKFRDAADFANGDFPVAHPNVPDLTGPEVLATAQAPAANQPGPSSPPPTNTPAAPTTAKPGLALTASGPTPSKATVGAPLRLVYLVANHGPGDASAVSFSADLPAGVLAGSASSSRGGCTTSNGKLVCYLGDFTAGQTATITTNLTVQKPGTFTLTPQASGREQTVAASTLTLTAVKAGGPTLELGGGAFQPPLQTRRLRRAALLRLTLSLDEQATLKLAVLTPNGRALLLLPGSSLAATVTGQPTHLLHTNANAGPITVYLRVNLAALRAGAAYRLRLGATDSSGTSTTFTFPFRRG